MGWYCKVYFQYHQESFLRISSITLKYWTCNPHVLFRVSLCSLTTFPFCFHLFLRTFQQPNPVCCNRSTTNLFMISFLSRTIDFFFSFWAYGFICGWPRPVSSRSAKLPGWRSPPIVTIVTIVIHGFLALMCLHKHRSGGRIESTSKIVKEETCSHHPVFNSFSSYKRPSIYASNTSIV